MRLIKTSEKIIIWMYRNNISGQKIADEIGITRQSWSNKLKNNTFTVLDLITIKSLGYKE